VLPGNRNVIRLTPQEVDRATRTFLSLEDEEIIFRYVANSQTRFRVVPAEGDQEEYSEIIFSEDLYPGRNIANPNAQVSMKAAIAHELAHYHRWRDKRELEGEDFKHLDEALTSLEAATRYAADLNDTEIQQLLADATERLRLHQQLLEEKNFGQQ
jgi:hypothetical protein